MPNLIVARRKLLQGSIAFAATSRLLGSKDSAAAVLSPTPPQTPGPFYPLAFPNDSDNDLVHVAGHAETARGSITRITGRILDPSGRPVSGARVEIWQCDANGRYHYVRDDRADQPIDENFQGYGQTLTGESGGYRFRTIRPVPYPGRTPHIHFPVSGAALSRFTTHMYV